MLLQNRDTKITIPHTSTCIIRTTGAIHDGDTVSIVSPIFASSDFQSGSIQLTETLDVPIVILNESRMIENPNGDYRARLICDDNDVFNLYVRIQ